MRKYTKPVVKKVTSGTVLSVRPERALTPGERPATLPRGSHETR